MNAVTAPWSFMEVLTNLLLASFVLLISELVNGSEPRKPRVGETGGLRKPHEWEM